jgi:hypothetical protein
LLDTTLSTDYFRLTDTKIDSVKSIIIRQYSSKKLIDEKDFTLMGYGESKLGSETIRRYDSHGNLIVLIDKMDGSIFSRQIFEYNLKGKILKEINLVQKPVSLGGTDQSKITLAQPLRKEQFQYDTTVIVNTYDDNGNLIQSVISDGNGKVRKTRKIEYEGNEKTFSYDISPQGDTMQKKKFERDGKLIKEFSLVRPIAGEDTTWYDGENIVEMIGHDDKRGVKYKFLTKYDDKGVKIESLSYK